MDSENQSNKTLTEQKQSWVDKIFLNPIFIIIISPLISHTLEYGLYQDSAPKDASSLGLVAIVFFTLISFVYFRKSTSIWSSQKLYFREDFSLHTFLGLSAFILTGFSSLFVKLTPWGICIEISKSILRQSDAVSHPIIQGYFILYK
jgi:hypothetical protein